MASTSSPAEGGGDNSKKKSIVIVDMPQEFINRDVLKEHFEKFGTVERLACSVSKKYAVIHFKTPEEAENALTNGSRIKPDAAPLKIYHSSKSAGLGSSGSKSSVLPVALPQGPGRIVTQRKIVRTFNHPPFSPLMAPSGTSELNPTASRSIPKTRDTPTASPSIPKTRDSPTVQLQTPTSQQHSWRSSLKVSRPSPFLRKRPSFGDKSGKTATGVGTTAIKNPFALPPRSMLSLDRRRKPSQEDGREGKVPKPSTSTADPRINEPASTSVADSEPVELLSPPQKAETTVAQESIPVQNTTVTSAQVKPVKAAKSTSVDIDREWKEAERIPEPPSVDIDETTEDVTAVDDLNETIDPEADDVDIYGEEAETQDTAEATTEEEGEIHDDDDNDDDDDEENEEEEDEPDTDDVYESPMKRIETETKGSNKDVFTTAATSSSSNVPAGAFSFKLGSKSSGSTAGPGSSSNSLFKLPFTSPFAVTDSLKPFSSSSFGIQFTVPNPSQGPSSSATVSMPQENPEPIKEKEKPKDLEKVFQPIPAKPKNVETQKEKPAKSTPFGLFAATTKSLPPTADTKSSVISVPKLGTNTYQVPGKRPAISSTTMASTSAAVSNEPAPAHTPKDTPNPLLMALYPDSSETQELFAKRAATIEDRYRILEARDKLIRARVPKTKVTVEQATKLIGTCPDMCPEKERYMRQFQRQLQLYEILPDSQVDHQRAVKVYSRSSADQEEPLPHELRPGPTLDFTMHYLLAHIVPLGDDPDENLSDWYHFLWDRTRSIRKDITQQQILDLTAVSLYEKCARFHIHCGSRLCQLDVHSFDPKLNDENLMKCLQSLEHLYDDLRRRQVTCPNEPEFRAYQIMMNLNEGDALYNAQQLPSWILNSEVVQIALKLHHSIFTKNFVAFFRSVEGLPYMTSCIVHRYFFQVRSSALRRFIKAHCTLPKYETSMPMSSMQRMLGYGINETQSFSFLCSSHGIHCDIDDDKVILKRKMFYLPEFPSIYREHHLIDSKLRTSVPEAINGGPLPNIDFASHKPHSSFNENGQLIPGAIIGSKDTNTTVSIPVQRVTTEIPASAPAKEFKLFRSPVVQSPFSFGTFQQRKEPHKVTPAREIDAACQVVAGKIIDESVKEDIAQLSQARLEEAREAHQKAERKRIQGEIATRVSLGYVETLISQHVDSTIKQQSYSNINRFKALDVATSRTVTDIIGESVLASVGLSARTELILAKDFHHRRIAALQNIFKRIRARFVLGKWTKFARRKRMEREMQQEKRRVELWNFPAINSYSTSTKDLFRVFCGKNSAQLSDSKVVNLINYGQGLDQPLRTPSENFPVRPKRKSEGDSVDTNPSSPAKLPRLNRTLSGVSSGNKSDYEMLRKLQELWEFPAINPYNKTTSQVFDAFCGCSGKTIGPVSSKITSITPVGVSSVYARQREEPPFIIGRGPSFNGSRLSEEIKTKAAESTSDFLRDIQSFLSKVKEENQNMNLEPVMESLNAFKKECPQLNSPDEDFLKPSSIRAYSLAANSNSDEVDASDRMEVDEFSFHSVYNSPFYPNNDLLSNVRRFARQVKEENAKSSWNANTFLNTIDTSIMS